MDTTYATKLHLAEALQYHEKLEELQKAFESAKQLLQEYVDDLKNNMCLKTLTQ